MVSPPRRPRLIAKPHLQPDPSADQTDRPTPTRFDRQNRIATRPLKKQDITFLANDWHAALVPVYLAAKYRPHGVFASARSVLAIHNLRHQVCVCVCVVCVWCGVCPRGVVCLLVVVWCVSVSWCLVVVCVCVCFSALLRLVQVTTT